MELPFPMAERLKFIARLLDGEKMRCFAGVRYLAQDGLQGPHTLQRQWLGRVDGPVAPAIPPRQSASTPAASIGDRVYAVPSLPLPLYV
ncbi:hypothetical protein ABID26_002390 [Mesorhizobium shonense]|uniref:Uncharacterized protein n=1 Tax=Mesorhizobium shonense TaxID=1209948 RepID=A0ABV2HS72_9HYPH